MGEVAPLSHNAVLGTMYVLEGSRLGAKYPAANDRPNPLIR